MSADHKTMATIFDVGLLRAFDVIFPVLLVFALVFAVLQKTKILGQALGINALVSVVVAFMVLLSEDLVNLVNFVTPWFAVAIIFFILLILCFQIFGAKETDIAKVINDSSFRWTIIGIAIVILIAGFASVFGQSLTQASFQQQPAGVNVTDSSGVATPYFEQNIYTTLFHPKVLGLMVLFAVAIFAVALLTG